MFGFGTRARKVICSGKVAHSHAPKDVLYVCGFPRCPAKDRTPLPDKPPGLRYTLFKSDTAGATVPCPNCSNPAFERVCPDCKAEIAPPVGPKTIAVVGSSSSGKTCFITALIRQIKTVLARRDSLRAGLIWEDQPSRNYFDLQHKSIFVEHTVPDPTQKNAPIKTIRITVRYPHPRKSRQTVVSLCFPDPAGEPLESMDQPYFADFLQQSEAIMLMVDPFATDVFKDRERLRGSEDYFAIESLRDATAPLNKVVTALRGENRRGQLSQKLAVVVTKCDADGVFNPDKELDEDGYPYAEQGVPYDSKLAKRMSDAVSRHLHDDLMLPGLVATAEAEFKYVHFFAASALGVAPEKKMMPDGSIMLYMENPNPRRVEEPLLWILHQWGDL
jgi:hypothetical protein